MRYAQGLLMAKEFAFLLRRDALRLREVLQQGLASPEHAAFVARLAAR